MSLVFCVLNGITYHGFCILYLFICIFGVAINLFPMHNLTCHMHYSMKVSQARLSHLEWTGIQHSLLCNIGYYVSQCSNTLYLKLYFSGSCIVYLLTGSVLLISRYCVAVVTPILGLQLDMYIMVSWHI
jgi:hypothetical protein